MPKPKSAIPPATDIHGPWLLTDGKLTGFRFELSAHYFPYVHVLLPCATRYLKKHAGLCKTWSAVMFGGFKVEGKAAERYRFPTGPDASWQTVVGGVFCLLAAHPENTLLRGTDGVFVLAHSLPHHECLAQFYSVSPKRTLELIGKLSAELVRQRRTVAAIAGLLFPPPGILDSFGKNVPWAKANAAEQDAAIAEWAKVSQSVVRKARHAIARLQKVEGEWTFAADR